MPNFLNFQRVKTNKKKKKPHFMSNMHLNNVQIERKKKNISENLKNFQIWYESEKTKQSTKHFELVKSENKKKSIKTDLK